MGRGSLIIAATPLGNLDDVTIRLKETLGRVDYIACEDTRVTSKITNRFGISARLISVREANEEKASQNIISLLENGSDVVYCSDAGTPGISDPGCRLVKNVRSAGFNVTILPGPSAVTSALAVSGFPSDSFIFLGFISKKSAARRAIFEEYLATRLTLVFYESPNRLQKFLVDAAEVLGERNAVVCRELSKKYEEIAAGTLGDLAARSDWKGEITVVIEGAAEKEDRVLTDDEAEAIVDAELAKGAHKGTKQLARRLAARHGGPVKRYYNVILEREKSS